MAERRAIAPILLIAVFAGTVLRDSFSGRSAAGAQQPRPAATAEPRAATPHVGDDQIDTLGVIADSLAVNISTEGLKARAQRAVRSLKAPVKDLERDWQKPVAYLRDFFDLPIRGPLKDLVRAKDTLERLAKGPVPAIGVEPTRARKNAAAELDGFLTRYFSQDALKSEHASDEAKLIAQDFESLDKSPLQLSVVEQSVRDQEISVDFLIATLPDPIDSYAGWQFDPMLDAISQAIAASDYVLDRFHFPDSDREEASSDSAAEPSGRLHELEPGVVVFRRHGTGADPENEAESRDGDRLVLLLVHENPTAGVHPRALANAIRFVVRCGELSKRDSSTTIRILGPTFSGSVDSIKRTLQLVERKIDDAGYSVRFVSGSATDADNKDIIEGAISRPVSFRATVHPDNVLFPEMVKEIDRAAWSERIAVLFESNTQYGRQLWSALNEQRQSHNDRTSPGHALELIQLPFPMNISRLRSTAQVDAARGPQMGLPSKFRALPMEGAGNPTDQIPQFFPNTTAAYVELALAGTLETMRREHVKTVALMATDPRDKLFLAQQISRHSPDVSIFTAESDSLYIHPDYSSYLQGALVVSTYPLYSPNQRWSYGYQGVSERRQFANGSAQGIYNAALALLHYEADGTRCHSNAPRLLEYGMPGKGCDKGLCVPPVWISVVGSMSAWPVRAYPQKPDSEGYVFAVREPAPQPWPAVYPSPLFNAVLILLTCPILGYWASVRIPTGRVRQSAVVENPPDPAADSSASRRGYLLVCLSGLMVVMMFIWALCFRRWWIEQSDWSKLALGAASFAILALADLSARTLALVVRHDLRYVRNLPSKWGIGAVSAVCVWSAWNLLDYVQQQPLESIGFVARSVDFGSGVSPTLPVVFLGSAVTLWGLVELARLRRPRVALAHPDVHPLIQSTMHGDLQKLKASWDLFNDSIVAAPPRLWAVAVLAFVATCVFAFAPYFRPLVTIEGYRFGEFVSAALLLIQVMLTLSLLQFVFLWLRLKQLLDRMAWHPLAAAYERVPRALFPTDLFPRTPRLLQLQIPVASWTRLVAACQPAGSEIPAESRPLDAIFEEEMRQSPRTPWSSSRTWRALLGAGQHAAARLQADGGAGATGNDAKREEFLASLMVFVIRDALARLGHNLVFVIGGMILVFCSHSLFPFQQRTQLRMVGWIYIACAFSAILTVLVQMKRNEIIGRLSSSTPGVRSTWDGEFVLKLAVFGLLPLLTLFAAQFPDLGGTLLQLVEPVQKALP